MTAGSTQSGEADPPDFRDESRPCKNVFGGGDP